MNATQIELAFDGALMLMRAGRRAEAGRVAWEILRQHPGHGGAWAMRATIEAEEGRYENALLHYGFALQISPGNHELWVNRGIDCANARMFKEAEESFIKALEIKSSFNAHFGYGNVLAQQMRIEAAVGQYCLAFGLDDENNAQLRVNYGECMMALGDWKTGFENYRHRFDTPNFPPHPRLKYPQWHGEPLDGKTILLFAEQGFGDEIMSLRLAEPLRARGARVILAVRPPVYRLALTYPHADAVMLLYGEPRFPVDYQCALLDVPSFVPLSPETVPLKGGYLGAEERGFRMQMPAGLNVGVCWASGKRDLQPHVAATAAAKSLSFDQLVRPLIRPGINFFSLQQTHGDDQAMRECGVRDPMSGVTDFADTAYIIGHLDLVITVDTSVAHLAGAMGKPVWNLVRHDAIWPWMQEYRESCWYDSMTVYRQEKPFDWSAPLKRLKADFDARTAQAEAAWVR